jgi:hypothetical protein
VEKSFLKIGGKSAPKSIDELVEKSLKKLVEKT